MKIQTIKPYSDVDLTIMKSSDLFVMIDHMPHISLDNCQGKTIDELKTELFGKNSYIPIFAAAGIDITNNFFIFDSYIYLEEFSKNDNVVYLPVALHQCANIHNKTVASTYIDFSKKTISFNCPMNNQRYNRIITSCWLYNNKNDLIFDYTQSWQSDEKNNLLFELLKIAELATWEGSHYEIKCLNKKHIISDVGGFNFMSNVAEYSNLLNKSAVSIVLNVNFWENGCSLDEKYFNAVITGTIPLCDGYKFYDTIKQIGLDTFDDIIDTSYQYELNPCLRAWKMMEQNKHLLSNGLKVIQRTDIQERILHNFELIKDPDTFLEMSFKKLNSDSAQSAYIKKYQSEILNIDPMWPKLTSI
jgi:hypothetical protein